MASAPITPCKRRFPPGCSSDDAAFCFSFVQRVCELYPQRITTTHDELGAQEEVLAAFKRCVGSRNIRVEWQRFMFNRSLYQNVALHFGTAVLGSYYALWCADAVLSTALYVLSAASYFCDSTRKAYILRKLFKWSPSQNLLVTLPATRGSSSKSKSDGNRNRNGRINGKGVVSAKQTSTDVIQRVVFMAHADATFTGWMFEPTAIGAFTKLCGRRNGQGTAPGAALGPTQKPLLMGLIAVVMLALTTLLSLAAGDHALVPLPELLMKLQYINTSASVLSSAAQSNVTMSTLATSWATVLICAFSIPPLIVFALYFQVAARNEVVPGAMDDLSGIASLVLLAQRFAQKNSRPENVEIVFAVTGAEQASLGGSDALAREMLATGRWDPRDTVIFGMDSPSNGILRWYREGELIDLGIPPELDAACRHTAASHPRFSEAQPFTMPAGGTDVAAFRYHGFSGVCLGCIDEESGVPLHYHHASDTPEHVEPDKIVFCVDFAEALVRHVLNVQHTA